MLRYNVFNLDVIQLHRHGDNIFFVVEIQINFTLVSRDCKLIFRMFIIFNIDEMLRRITSCDVA